MEDIICLKCGSVNHYYTEVKANNNVARCNECDAFIKNLPYENVKFYVGKYKGKAIIDIEDLGYLKWASVNMNGINKRVKDAIQKRIDALEHLAR